MTKYKDKTPKQKRNLIIVLSIIAAIILTLLILMIVFVVPVTGEKSNEHWYSRMEYTDDYAINLEKKPGEDFKILAIADPQLADLAEIGPKGDPLAEIELLVEKERPDLIVVQGDITWTAFTKLSVKKFVKCMDKLGIPWAPIMGNHEDEKEQGYYCNVDKNWVADQMMKSKTCLFKKGPNNIGGVGNYVINIKENGKIKQTLIFMDTHAKRIYPEFDNKVGYDYIYDSQMDWYRWVINGVTNLNGGIKPDSMLYIHIPLVEYGETYKEWEAWNKDQIENGKNDEDPYKKVGEKNEKECPGLINSGMFDLIKELDSTKYVFAGHDHINNYSLLYKGVRLSYITKTGYKCSYKEGRTGGTYIIIGDNVSIRHAYAKYDNNKLINIINGDLIL